MDAAVQCHWIAECMFPSASPRVCSGRDGGRPSDGEERKSRKLISPLAMCDM